MRRGCGQSPDIGAEMRDHGVYGSTSTSRAVASANTTRTPGETVSRSLAAV